VFLAASQLIGAAPFQNALLMAGYGAGRRWSSGTDEADGDSRGPPRYRDIFMGGVVGGVAQCVVASPAELFKVQRQVSDMGNNKQCQKRPKITAGMGATLLRDGLPHGIWFASYEWCKYMMTRSGSGRSDESSNSSGVYDQMIVPLTSGAFAATLAWVIGYPFDLIKTRIQAGRAASVWDATVDLITIKDPITSQKTYLDTSSAIRKLWSGLELKLARAVPASAIGFVAYEYVLGIIERQAGT
jgi:solute carrier family 25 carnitine/acylcarnitine transporter 20/29